jgi:signal transduction histidine kinase
MLATRDQLLERELQQNLQVRVAEALLPAMAAVGLTLCIAAETFRQSWDILGIGWFLVFAPVASGFMFARSRTVGIWSLVLSFGALGLVVGSRYGWALGMPIVALATTLVTLLLGTTWGLGVAGCVSLGLLGSALLAGGLSIGSAALALAQIWLPQLALFALTASFSDAIGWSWQQYQLARAQLEESLDQRVELKRTRDDLVQANNELERLSQRLEAMTLIAENALQTKEQFLANVSHELRTPLNMIIGFSEMMTETPGVYGSQLPSALLADVSVIQRNSQHLASLVDDILDLSKAEAGRVALERDQVNVANLIDAAVATVGPLFTTRGLYLTVDIEPSLPDLSCDSTRIRQVILNLLSNAGRFTRAGGVAVRAYQEQGALVCSVRDTGPGIEAANLERIFEPFHQVGPRREKEGGSGLGLSISRMFVSLHGGKMWAESAVGQGTTFYFRLPFAPSQRGGNAPLGRWFSPYADFHSREGTSRAPRPDTPPRLVTLEPGHALADLLRRYAGEIQVTSVLTLDQAVQELNRAPALALVVNDRAAQHAVQQIPQLSRLPFGTPAVVCWMPGDAETMEQLGIARYLTKPIQRDRLLEAVGGIGRDVGTILVVDDQPEAVQLLARMLASADGSYQVLRTTSGRRALSLMRERQPDLVLLDLYMPEMSGFQVLEAKKADPAIAGIPVVVISAHAPDMPAQRGNCLSVVLRDRLTVEDLLAALQMVSGLYGSDQQSPHPALPETPPA